MFVQAFCPSGTARSGSELLAWRFVRQVQHDLILNCLFRRFVLQEQHVLGYKCLVRRSLLQKHPDLVLKSFVRHLKLQDLGLMCFGRRFGSGVILDCIDS